MVSSGISNGVNPVRPVEAPKGKNNSNSDVDFGIIMSQQALTAGNDSEKNQFAGPNVQNTSTKTLMNTAAPASAEKRVKDVSTVKTDKASVSDKPAEPATGISDKVKEVTNDIRDKIKEEFDVTDEDIERALEALGMVITDLLDEGNLTDFVVELTGMENAVELLVSPEISGQLSELSDFISDMSAELSEEFDVPAEELTDFLQNAVNVQEDIPEEHTEQTAEPVIRTAVVETAVGEPVEETRAANADRRERTHEKPVEEDVPETAVQNPKEIVVKVERAQDKASSQNNHGSDLAGKNNTEPVVNPIVNNFANAVNEVFEMQGLNERIDPVQIIEQIVEAAKITLNQEVTTMELMLNPESLGKINMMVSVKEGVVTATLAAQNETAREAIESQIVILKENLNNQGIKVEAVEVTVESHAFDANANQNQNNGFDEQREQAQKKNSRPLRLDSLEDLNMEDLTEEERIVMDMMASEGNQINFTA